MLSAVPSGMADGSSVLNMAAPPSDKTPPVDIRSHIRQFEDDVIVKQLNIRSSMTPHLPPSSFCSEQVQSDVTAKQSESNTGAQLSAASVRNRRARLLATWRMLLLDCEDWKLN